jgi:hypothetical protein
MVTYGNRKIFLAPYLRPGPACKCPPETPATPCTQPLHVLPRRLAAPEHQREGGFTLIVTSKFDIFFTVSIPNSKNTHHRPLPPNDLRKMPEETVKFCVDIACRAGASERRRVTHHAHCHLRISPFLHRFCTVFRIHSLLPIVRQQLKNRPLKNGAIPGLSRRLAAPKRSEGEGSAKADLSAEAMRGRTPSPKWRRMTKHVLPT